MKNSISESATGVPSVPAVASTFTCSDLMLLASTLNCWALGSSTRSTVFELPSGKMNSSFEGRRIDVKSLAVPE